MRRGSLRPSLPFIFLNRRSGSKRLQCHLRLCLPSPQAPTVWTSTHHNPLMACCMALVPTHHVKKHPWMMACTTPPPYAPQLLGSTSRGVAIDQLECYHHLSLSLAFLIDLLPFWLFPPLISSRLPPVDKTLGCRLSKLFIALSVSRRRKIDRQAVSFYPSRLLFCLVSAPETCMNFS